MKKIKKYYLRPESVITDKSNLVSLYTIKDFPVFFGCVNTLPKDDLYADMEWGIDPETGVIQLIKLIPLEILYQSQHVDGCGPTWRKYYEDFVEYILRSNVKRVLEIGGGQGQLAEMATKKSKDLNWIIVEPNPTHSGSDRIKIIPKFFEEGIKIDDNIDVVVFSQLLEHIYKPRQFIESISKFLDINGKLIFAYPNLTRWLKNKYTNAINFEHTMFLTSYYVDYLLRLHSFEIEDKRKYKGHSYFYTAQKKKKVKDIKLRNRYKEYKKIFLEFIDYHRKMVVDLNEKMSRVRRPIYCFGAHIFTTYLLAFGLNTNKIVTILDNSPTKRGKRLYGTNFIVKSPRVLKGKGKVYVILKAGIYNNEIKKDILENINSEVIFW